MTSRDEILKRIKGERERQIDSPGSEWDANNSPGDWVALIGHYVNEEVRRNGVVPKKEDFEDSLVKAAAVIIAALEHIDLMTNRKELS